jgi:hypothetical protein
MVRYIGKCRECKQTSARDYNDFRTVTLGQGMFKRQGKQYGRMHFEHWIKASADVWCPRCKQAAWNAKPVDGVTTEHKCDVRCTDAKGFRCECSCGGARHGQGFLVCEEIALDA